MLLSKLWERYNILYTFKVELNKKGYVGKDIVIINEQLKLLKEIIEIESIIKLKELLINKTYFRLLKTIEKGIEYLPDIIQNETEYVLNYIENDNNAWISKDVLIFTTKNNIGVFSKISRKMEGYHYLDKKWQ